MSVKKNSKTGGVNRQGALMFGVIGFFLGFIIGVVYTSYKIDGSPDKIADSQQPVNYQQQSVNYQERENSLKAELESNPGNISAWIQLGHVYFDTDQYGNAVAAYEKALAIDPNNADVLTDLGIMYRRSGQPGKAIECFDKAVSVDQNHENARFNKGIVLMHDIKDREKALEVWEALLEINPVAMVGNNQSLDQLIKHYKEHE